ASPAAPCGAKSIRSEPPLWLPSSFLPAELSRPGRPLGLAGVPAIRARRHELTQLVADHVFGDVDRHVPPAVVHRKGVPDERGKDGRIPRPSLDNPLFPGLVHLPNLFQQTRMSVRPLLARPAHGQPPPRGSLAPPPDDVVVRLLVLLARAISKRRLA